MTGFAARHALGSAIQLIGCRNRRGHWRRGRYWRCRWCGRWRRRYGRGDDCWRGRRRRCPNRCRLDRSNRRSRSGRDHRFLGFGFGLRFGFGRGLWFCLRLRFGFWFGLRFGFWLGLGRRFLGRFHWVLDRLLFCSRLSFGRRCDFTFRFSLRHFFRHVLILPRVPEENDFLMLLTRKSFFH